MKHLKIVFFDLIFIIGCFYFLAFPTAITHHNNVDSIKIEISSKNLLTTSLNEYFTKAEAIYNTKNIDIIESITELNQNYPKEVAIILNNYYNNK